MGSSEQLGYLGKWREKNWIIRRRLDEDIHGWTDGSGNGMSRFMSYTLTFTRQHPP